MAANAGAGEPIADREVTITRSYNAPARSGKMIMTVTFEEKDGRTTLTWHTLFESVAMKKEYVGMGFEQGAGSGLDQLTDVAARLKAAA